MNVYFLGIGAGDLNIKAECRLLSETYEVIDANFKDIGTTGNSSNNWRYSQTLTRTITDTGTVIANSSGATRVYVTNKPNTSTDAYDWVGDFIIEFDCLSRNGSIGIHIQDSFGNDGSFGFATLGISNNHVKLVKSGNTITPFVDGVEKTGITADFKNCQVLFSISDGASFEYKNFVVYGMMEDYIILNFSSNIVGYGEDLTLTATLYNGGAVASGKTVTFNKNNVSVGTAVTNANGVATLTYTGAGTGEVEFSANSESIQSEIYGLIDAAIRDGGVTGDTNTNAFGYNTTYITVATDSIGTAVENTESTIGNFRAFTSRNPTNNTYIWNGDFAIEVDIVSSSSDNRVQLYVDNSNLISRTAEELGISAGGHLKIEYKNGTAIYYVNGVEAYTRTISLSNYNIRFFLPSLATFTYKNFVVYPI